MQFITAGCVQGIIGFIFYFSCSTLHDYRANDTFEGVTFIDKQYEDCTTTGPASAINPYVDIPAFFSQLLLIWIAFLLLCCAIPKGKPKLRY